MLTVIVIRTYFAHMIISSCIHSPVNGMTWLFCVTEETSLSMPVLMDT